MGFVDQPEVQASVGLNLNRYLMEHKPMVFKLVKIIKLYPNTLHTPCPGVLWVEGQTLGLVDKLEVEAWTNDL